MSIIDKSTDNNFNRDFIYTIPQTVLFDKSMNLVDIRVYMLVRSFLDTTRDAFFSNQWAANLLGVDPLSISRSISKQIKRGHLERFDINGRRHLRVGKPIRHEEVSQQGVDLQIKGGRSTDQGGVDLQINILDQSRLLQSNIFIAQKEIEEMFNHFWERYPLKKGRQKALEAFSKQIKGKPKEEAKELARKIWEGFMAHLAEYNAKHEIKAQGADIWIPELPHFSTWLNQKRWEDQYEDPNIILSKATYKRGTLDLDKIFQ